MGHVANSFTIQFWNSEVRSVKMSYVNYVETAVKWMDSKQIDWTHAMIYDRKTGDKIERIKNEKLIEPI